MRRTAPQSAPTRAPQPARPSPNCPQPTLHLWPERSRNLLWRDTPLTLSAAALRRTADRGCSGTQHLLATNDGCCLLQRENHRHDILECFSRVGCILGVRDILNFIHVQHYNAGTVLGLDGVAYASATAYIQVAMAEMLMVGFPVAGNPDRFFPITTRADSP